MAEFDQQFVDYIVKALVNNPDAVHTERTVDEQGVFIVVKADPSDVGYLIGKGGKTAIAIRTLLATLGAKNNLRISFRIDAPLSEERRQEESSAPAPHDAIDVAVDTLTF